MSTRYIAIAEFLGTLWFVFAGCETAVIAASFPQGGVGLLGVALAFGLSLVVMTYAFGHISGAHFNPAVTIGSLAAGGMPLLRAVVYIIAQLLGAIAACGILARLASGKPGFDLLGSGFAANGYQDHSPGGYGLGAAFLGEAVATFFFVIVALRNRTHGSVPSQSAAWASGIALSVGYLVMLPISGASLNPARSTAPALFLGGWALRQLWVFWVAPLIGAVVAGLVHGQLEPSDDASGQHREATDPSRK